ncbi:sulfur carrier protein ThiS [Candidatus Sumerlaeota bacterium]|nr:sulfur carrier protein ThiS [Candidatus Sumerlaeota bacterium]
MQITLNGQPFAPEREISVAALLEMKEIKGRRVAVMINDEVVKRENFPDTLVREGDRVEIIQMVGGG